MMISLVFVVDHFIKQASASLGHVIVQGGFWASELGRRWKKDLYFCYRLRIKARSKITIRTKTRKIRKGEIELKPTRTSGGH